MQLSLWWCQHSAVAPGWGYADMGRKVVLTAERQGSENHTLSSRRGPIPCVIRRMAEGLRYSRRIEGLPGKLPDADTVLGAEVQLLTGLHAKRRIPRIEVAHGIAAIAVRRVRVGHDLLTKHGLAFFLRPALPEGNQKLLVATEAVLGSSGLACQCGMIAVVRGGEPGNIGDVFGERLLAVQ